MDKKKVIARIEQLRIEKGISVYPCGRGNRRGHS